MLRVKDIAAALATYNQDAYVDINLLLSENYKKGERLYYVSDNKEDIVVLNVMDEESFISSVVKDFDDPEISSKSSEELCEVYHLEKEAFAPLLEKARKIAAWATL